MRIVTLVVAAALVAGACVVLSFSAAHAQAMGGASAGRPSERSPAPPPPDAEKKKKDEKAFNDAVSRIPTPEKKYDPWGVVRDNGKH